MRTTFCTPVVVLAISVARSASRLVTRPSRYTVPRSVTTLNALAYRSRASTKAAVTRPVASKSLERWVRVVFPKTLSSLKVPRTFSTF